MAITGRLCIYQFGAEMDHMKVCICHSFTKPQIFFELELEKHFDAFPTDSAKIFATFLMLPNAQFPLHRVPLTQWKLGVSAGVCLYPEDGQTYQELYRVADARLYAAKNAGRGRIVTHD